MELIYYIGRLSCHRKKIHAGNMKSDETMSKPCLKHSSTRILLDLVVVSGRHHLIWLSSVHSHNNDHYELNEDHYNQPTKSYPPNSLHRYAI